MLQDAHALVTLPRLGLDEEHPVDHVARNGRGADEHADVDLDQVHAGGGSGAIFTTTPDGSIVNENVHYDFKREVYLDGGPPNNAPAKAERERW